jgi:hypothetical protein
MGFLLFSLVLGMLFYFSQTIRLELAIYTVGFIYEIFSLHHYYLDSIIWRKDAAKNLAMPW